MQLVRGIHNITDQHQGCVLTIGNFDGVHLGHRRVIQALVAKAQACGLPAAVMVFEPQPQEVFNPNGAPARLSTLREKVQFLKNLGVQRLICVKFSKQFAAMRAEAFIESLLVDKLGVSHLIIGDDFRFGKDRLGDFAMLCRFGGKLNFTVTDTDSFKLDHCRISSTEIRRLLATDQLTLAAEMLGRPYTLLGRVVHGEKQGRLLGYPTANVMLKRKHSPVKGVYAVMVDTDLGQFKGVANVGSRPTLNGEIMQLEVHIFDFNNDLYGQQIAVALVKKIRDERKFPSLAALTQQIKLDSSEAQTFFAGQ